MRDGARRPCQRSKRKRGSGRARSRTQEAPQREHRLPEEGSAEPASRQ